MDTSANILFSNLSIFEQVESLSKGCPLFDSSKSDLTFLSKYGYSEKEHTFRTPNDKPQEVTRNVNRILERRQTLPNKSTVLSATYSAICDPSCDFIGNIEKADRKGYHWFDLSHRMIVSYKFADSLKSFDHLHTLSLSDVGMTEIPKQLLKLPKCLRYLDLSSNGISTFPQKMKWKYIEGLNISNNSFSLWPDYVSPDNFQHLQYLLMAHNQIECIPDFPTSFPQILGIDISFNNLKELSAFILKLTTLKYLDISNNHNLKNISIKSFENMSVLRILNVIGITINESGPSNHVPNRIIK